MVSKILKPYPNWIKSDLQHQAQRCKKTRESKKIHGGMNLSQQQRKDDEKLVVENSLRRRSVEKSLTP